MTTLLYQDLGALDYSAALALQESLVEKKHKEDFPDTLLFVEHPHVITLGRGGNEANVVDAAEVAVIRSSRGGDVTYHGPGQLVVYPIIDLKSKLRKDVHRYLRWLEQTAIRTLADFGIAAERRPPCTGIWIGKKKIAAIGVAVRRGITYHGLALNVSTDLNFFKRIVPCGLAWSEVTSIEQELGKAVPLEEVKTIFLRRFARRFGYSEIKDFIDFQAEKELCPEGIPTGLKSSLPAAPITSGSSGF
jgi:lipoyl(octanoyl) transferase